MIGLALHQSVNLLDTFSTLLGLQRQHQSLLMLSYAVGEVFRLKLELLGILVRLVVLRTMDLHLFLLFLILDGIDRRAIVPGIHLLINELTFLAFIPYRAVGLIDADDVHVLVQGGSLLSEHLLIGTVEDAARLTGIGSLLCLHGAKGRQKQHQHEYNPYSHSFFHFRGAKLHISRGLLLFLHTN